MLAFLATATLVALTAALALSVAVALDGDPLPGDLRMIRWAQDLPAFHTIARAFRWGMGTEGVLIAGGVLALALFFARRRWEAGVLVAVLIVLRVLQPLIKDIVDRERPPTDLVDRRAGFSSESFPSGHMMSATVLCGMVIVIAWRLPLATARKWVFTAGMVLLVALNGTSSMYMGVHWPSDIIGGWLWGAVIVLPAAGALNIASGPRR